MKFRSLILLAGLVLAPVTAGRAQAQDTPRADAVQAELDRTDMRIEQAESLVMGSDNDQATTQLNMAIDFQSRAKSAFASTELALSLRLTLDARAHADKAIAIVKNLPDPDRVKAQLERTRELLERAKERIEECNNDRARAQLKAAFELQARAEEAAMNGRYLVALQLTVNARERALRALRLCHLEENIQEAADRAIQKTDQVIERAQNVLENCDSERSKLAFGHAVELQVKAKAEFAAEHYRASLNLTFAARRAAYRAVRLCAHVPGDRPGDSR